MPTVVLPGALRPLAGGVSSIVLAGGPTLRDVLDELEGSHPALARRIRDEQGRLRRYVNVYVDGEDVRASGSLATEVAAGAEVLVLPSVAGG